ncbi:MAG TPA: thiamine pyrophosphate-dependent enzyme [Terracidiphilus sp.]|nr:thiamine pyrophosphate-dependent enzyme [Terracidiphilus sp.]
MKKKVKSARATRKSPAEFSLISSDTLLALHRNLLLCRAKTRRLRQAQRASHDAAEYDAVVVAFANDLIRDDHVTSTARSELIESLRGKPAAGPRIGRGSRADLATMLHSALGAALTHKTGKTRKVTLVFGADGNSDAWRNALEAARLHSLPIVFASTIDLAREERNHAQVRRKLPPGTELPQITVDGNDVVAVYRVAHEAIERARRDRGPTLIECAEYRLRGRTHNDPVTNMEAYLKGKGLLQPRLRKEARATGAGRAMRHA